MSVITLSKMPQADQKNLFKNLEKRYFVGVIGRQYGKSTMCQLRAVRRAYSLSEQTSDVYWWLSPTISQAKVQFERALKEYYELTHEKSMTDRKIVLKNGAQWYFKGADSPDNLRGDTLSGVTVDEAASMRSDVWFEIIRPALSVKKGWADFIGTPKGKNWFFDIRNQALNSDEYHHHHAPSNRSPFFSDSELEAAKQTTPELVFRQEYLAEFIDTGGEVFRHIKECISGELEEPRRDSVYVMGVDLARTQDFTVITVFDRERKHLVFYDRFNNLDWPVQEQRIIAAANRYRAPIEIDATGVGDPVFQRLQRSGLQVNPIRLTNERKRHIIENLAFMIEKREVTYPDIPELIHELNVYSSETTPAGNVRYNAPSGYHDDIVVSMALASAKLSKTQIKVFDIL